MSVAVDANTGPLSRRARRLLLALTLPLFVVVVAIAVLQYRTQRGQVQHDLAVASGNHAISLDHVAQLASDHVVQMQSWMQRRLADTRAPAHPLRAAFAPRSAAGVADGYALDALPAEQRDFTGQLVALPGDPRRADFAPHTLDAALGLYDVVRLTHERLPYFRWSYFLAASKDFVSTFPWVPSDDLVAGSGHPSLAVGLPKTFEYEIFIAGTPEKNAARIAYWTEPYYDSAGTGAMVSAGAPVDVGGRFLGIVATDLKLDTLEAYVKLLPHDVGRLWVLDANDRVLADSAGTARQDVPTFTASSGGISAAALSAARGSAGQAVEADGHTIVARRLSNAPWTLVFAVPDREIEGLLLPRFVPYGLILALLAATVAASLWLLRRRLIGPALALADYIQRASAQRTEVPALPGAWQPVADKVATTLADHRDAMRRISQSESFKSAIVDNALLAVVTADAQGRIVEFNPAAEALFQRTREAARGRDAIDLLIAAEERVAYRSHIAGLLGSDRRELTALRADGTTLPVEISLSATEVDGQRYQTAFVVDLSERKAAERAFAQQREALRQSEKLSAMGALLAGVAHELNNPLAILMGRSALLEAKATDPAVKTDAAKIHAAADRCGRIVRTFLSMARQRPAQRRRVQLADVVAGAVDLVGYNLRSSGIAVTVDVPRTLPALDADVDQIGQVLVNLLVNAQQALAGQPEPRRVQVVASCSARGVSLVLADNGPGVAADVRERIFDPFFTTKPEGAGTGVGLSVSRAIAREHGGDLTLREPASPGAAFELWLPVGSAPVAPEVVPVFADSTPRTGTALVVDDEPEVAQLLCDVLRSAGLAATTVESGREALAWLEANDCSFILCDVRMPDMDGPALWRALNARHPQLVSRLAFVTGDTLSASIAPFLRETGLPSLEKPFTPEEVLELVARIDG